MALFDLIRPSTDPKQIPMGLPTPIRRPGKTREKPEYPSRLHPANPIDETKLRCKTPMNTRKDSQHTLTLDALGRGDALLIVDVQTDFCPGGALPIEDGDGVVPIINRWIEFALEKGASIYASRDWHPVQHMSFAGHGGPWPPHCIQDSDGARFHPDLRLPDSTVKITKGARFDQDQNSAFDETGLSEWLRKENIRRLWVMGLAEDVCVLATALDGRRNGFEVVLVKDATRAVTPEGGEKARARIRNAGAFIL
uniref:nicotinamidase n=1 Tax=Candidatus Kentrum sp. TC TaxID=2126339 RepID=A0A450ZHC0_9GAMM|nr:MAG: nicotinamidase/pyrazinamidase [Candidatus Kentron sp. TC]